MTPLPQVLQIARRNGLVAANDAGEVARPKVTHEEARHLSVGEVRALLEPASQSRIKALLQLLVAAGLRRGGVGVVLV